MLYNLLTSRLQLFSVDEPTAFYNIYSPNTRGFAVTVSMNRL